MLRTWYKPVFLFLRVLESNWPPRVQLDRFASMKAWTELLGIDNSCADVECSSRNPSSESLHCLVKTCFEMCAVHLIEVYSPAHFNERSMQLSLSTGVAAELETGWNLDTKSRRDKCSSELRTAQSKILMANPPYQLGCNRHRGIHNGRTKTVGRVGGRTGHTSVMVLPF